MTPSRHHSLPCVMIRSPMMTCAISPRSVAHVPRVPQRPGRQDRPPALGWLHASVSGDPGLVSTVDWSAHAERVPIQSFLAGPRICCVPRAWQSWPTRDAVQTPRAPVLFPRLPCSPPNEIIHTHIHTVSSTRRGVHANVVNRYSARQAASSRLAARGDAGGEPPDMFCVHTSSEPNRKPRE